jgi:monofunctional biosynthetic peptidoglycan transglycosylase
MRFLKKTVLLGLLVIALLVLGVSVWIFTVLADLPDVSLLKQYRPPAASEVLDRSGTVIAHYYDRKFRVWVPIADLPDIVIRAVVTAEDDTFFGHQGVNYQAVWEALKHDMQKKRFARGGSTITQQMIKNVLLSKEKTFSRKLREYVLARRAEEVLTKRKILEIYLNEVEWGENIYGVEAASRWYYDKHAAELTPAEAALLAGMLPNPRYYDPFKRPDKARKRQEQVLFNMQQAKLLTADEYQKALAEPPRLREPSSRRFDLSAHGNGAGRPCHLRVLEQVLLEVYGERALYRSGMKLQTTLDRALQESLSALISSGSDTSAVVPDRVLAVREGTEIRALLCTENEEAVRFFLAPLGSPDRNFEVATMDPESVTKDMIAGGEGRREGPAPAAGASQPVSEGTDTGPAGGEARRAAE